MNEKRNVVKEILKHKTCCIDQDEDDRKQEHCDEDEVFDVMTLRKLVKIERQRATDAYLELEKERMASMTAADEAMGMILRLQNEKSVAELEAHQHRRLNHEKQLHDREVIRSLRWIVMKHESERSLLEDRLRLCKQRLMIYMNDDGEDDGCEVSFSFLDERLVSSLDLGLSPWLEATTAGCETLICQSFSLIIDFRVKRYKTLRPQNSAQGNSNSSTTSEPSWRQRYPPRVPNFIGGMFIDSQSRTSIDVINPATQQVVSQVPLTTGEEFRAAVFAAKCSLSSWRNTPVLTRQRIMFRFQELIRRDIDKIAQNITSEHGKTLKDARNEMLRGLEVVEHACGMTSLQMGEFVSNMRSGVDSYSLREPLGVCAGICPSNFPALVPLLMFPIAVACGNTFILKPSEKDPGACMILAELAMEAGLPNGVLNIVHGTNDIVNAICDDDDIKAITFVGPDSSGSHMHARASSNGKRVQSNIGAKNHAIVMPDANMGATLDALAAAGFGGAGQRCTTLNTVVFVGGSKTWEEKLLERAKALKVNVGTDADTDIGPVINKTAKENVSRLVQVGINAGARLILDGRHIEVPKYEMGNFVGPVILSDVTDGMECYKLAFSINAPMCFQAGSLEEAIAIVNRNRHGFGASIFTKNGASARKFQTEIEAGQVGVNVPVPAPLPFFAFTGTEASFSGDLNFHGKTGVDFYTQMKTVNQQWKDFRIDDEVPLEMLPNNFQSSDGTSLLLPTHNFPNTDDERGHLASPSDNLECDNGPSFTMPHKDFQTGEAVSLGLQLRDFQNSDGVSPALLMSDGSQDPKFLTHFLNWSRNA
ncbi:hypothetical protein R6Q57_029473 [Mikania cordata]